MLGHMVASLVAQRLKRLPAMRETWVRSLGWEDCPGEGNGNPLQYSCLENPMDGGAWWATSHRVEKSRTRLSAFTSLHFNRIDNSNRGGSKKGKKSKRIYRSSQSIRIINVFLESLLSESFPSLRVTVHLTSLGCPPTLC